jgi:hypothetical protein
MSVDPLAIQLLSDNRDLAERDSEFVLVVR